MNYKEQKKRHAFFPSAFTLIATSIIASTSGFASDAVNTGANEISQQASGQTDSNAVSKNTDQTVKTSSAKVMNMREGQKTDLQKKSQPGLAANEKADQTTSSSSDSTTQKTMNDPKNDTKMGSDAKTDPVADSNAGSDDLLPDDEPAPQKDPLEKLNRGIFTFNDKIDKIVLKPVATVYNKIMPKPLNQGVHNFYNNIGTLPTIANDILQLHFYQAANDIWRFGINSTIGIAGFFDIATRMNLKYYSNDFGLTMARWGYKNSTYIVWPFFGPSTIRDGIGIPVDYFAFSVYPYVNPTSARYELYGLGVVDRRAQLLKIESVMEEAALDRYVFVRNAYTQRRRYQIEQNLNDLGYKQQQEEAKTESQEKPVSATSAGPATNAELTPEAT